MGKDEVFEKQCQEISDRLDGLSDWQVQFYLYCLLPRYVEMAEKEADKIDTNTVHGVWAAAKEQEVINTLRSVREVLTLDLF